MGPGENAGAVDVGDGLAVAFKVESHNHPSAVEPFQGAATGVGGILRDVFAIGARPIAILDSLRFGELDSARSRYLLDHAVAGHRPLRQLDRRRDGRAARSTSRARTSRTASSTRCAWASRPKDKMIRSAAAGVGNVIVLFGALTGRDGIGGASVLASAELGEDEDKRPSVQIGDPFEEKKLLESSLELLDRGLLASLQDLGAAGLTSSSSEMASKGEVGIEIDVDKVPLREADMEPFEVMISESQERMLCVVEPDKLDEVLAVCEKWEVRATAIGTVTDTRRLRGARRRRGGGRHAGRGARRRLPALRPRARPSRASRSTRRRAAKLDGGESPADTLLALLASPNVASKRWAFEQYDWIVGSRTTRRPEEADAAVLMLEPDGGTGAIAVSIDGNGRRVACDPYTGAVEAVLECARNLACVGAEPLGLTNCLNFGNPEKPHIAWQLTRAVEGLRDACLARRRAGRGRQRLALQRGRRRADLPDAGRRAWSASCPTRARCRGARSARPGHAIALVGPVRARRSPAPSSRSCRAGSRRELPRDRPRRVTRPRSTRSATRCARVPSRRRTTSPRAGSRARSPSARSRAASARRSTSASDFAAVRRGTRRRAARGPARGHREARRIPATARFSGDRRDGRRPARHHGRRCYALRAGGSCARGPRRVTAEPVRMTPQEPIPDRDGPRDECGVFGVYAPESDVARLAYFALYALQHRGPGVGRHRHLRERPHHDPARPRPRLAGLRRDEAARADRLDGGRPRALLDDRLVGVGERPAGLPLGPPRGRARPQRQPDQRARAARGALGARRRLPLHLRLGADRGDALDPRGGHARGRARGRDAAARGRLLDGRDDERLRRRVPRRRRACARSRSGQVGDRYCVASESCAFDIIGARFLRDVQPGEMVSLSERGIETQADRQGPAALVLRLRAHLLRAPRLAARGQPHPGVAPQDGRDPVARGAGGRGRRDRRAGLGQPGGGRLREGVGDHARRRPDQEPLRRAHVHPARPGAAQARPADEVQPAARGGARQAHRRRGRLDRARQHDAPDRDDAARRRRDRGAHAHLGAADPLPVPLRHRHVHVGGDDRPRPLGRGGRARARLRLARLPLARGRLRGDPLDARDALRRLLHRRVPARAHATRRTGSSRSRKRRRSGYNP